MPNKCALVYVHIFALHEYVIDQKCLVFIYFVEDDIIDYCNKIIAAPHQDG